MRSVRPDPGNPWPHDMTITVEDRPATLLELLWLREAHDLAVEGDSPQLLVDTPASAAHPIAGDQRSAWATAWPRIWTAAAQHAGTERDPHAFSRVMATADGSAERAALLAQMAGPSWRDEVGDEAFDDASYRDWERRGSEAHRASMRERLAESPEHRDLEALIPAWEKGLTVIVAIPCRGDYTRTVGPSGLLITAGTRTTSAAYRAALATFDPS